MLSHRIRGEAMRGEIHFIKGSMKHINRLVLLYFLTLLGSPSYAQTENVSITDFNFLSGYWTGTGFGGQSEEIWMPAVDGRMFGIFKQSQDGELVFTEFMEIVEDEESFVVRLKHFNPDFSGWEEKTEHVTFRLSDFSKNKAVFGGLSYEIVEPNKLQVKLRMRNDDGSTVVEVFDFTRIEL